MKDSPRLYPLNGRTAIYGGRADLVAKVNGETYVVDFKTGTKPKRDAYYEWRLQTAAYRYALPQYDVRGHAVLHLDKTSGLPTWYDFSDTYELDLQAWSYLIGLYRIMLYGKFNPELEVPSVTSACSVLDKSGPLMWWATDCMGEYIRNRITKDHKDCILNSGEKECDHLISVGYVSGIVDEAKRNYRKVAQEAADIGSQVHACIEGFLRTGVEPQISDERILSGFVAFLEWRDTVKLEVIAQEIVVYG